MRRQPLFCPLRVGRIPQVHHAATVKMLGPEPDQLVDRRNVRDDGVHFVIEVRAIPSAAFGEIKRDGPMAV